MARNRGLSFRLLYRVVFFFFCLSFACFYGGDGGSGHITRNIKTESRDLNAELNNRPSKRKGLSKQDKWNPHMTQNFERVDDEKTVKKPDLTKMRGKI